MATAQESGRRRRASGRRPSGRGHERTQHRRAGHRLARRPGQDPDRPGRALPRHHAAGVGPDLQVLLPGRDRRLGAHPGPDEPADRRALRRHADDGRLDAGPRLAAALRRASGCCTAPRTTCCSRCPASATTSAPPASSRRPASPSAGRSAEGRDVIVWPGGEKDAMRSWRRRDVAELGGRKGFVRQAIRSGVPILPVATVGGHDTVFVLSEGQWLANALDRFTGLKKTLRGANLPIVAGLPVPARDRGAAGAPAAAGEDPHRVPRPDRGRRRPGARERREVRPGHLRRGAGRDPGRHDAAGEEAPLPGLRLRTGPLAEDSATIFPSRCARPAARDADAEQDEASSWRRRAGCPFPTARCPWPCCRRVGSATAARPAGPPAWAAGRSPRPLDNLATTTAARPGRRRSVCLWRCRRAGPLRRAGLALGIGLVGWGFGQAIWSWYELVAHREVPFPSVADPFPSLADAGFLTFPVAAAVALLVFPRGQGTTEGRVRALLDGLIIACSLLVLSMESVLAAVIRASAETTFALVISVAYPIGDIVVASMALLALAHARRPQRPPADLDHARARRPWSSRTACSPTRPRSAPTRPRCPPTSAGSPGSSLLGDRRDRPADGRSTGAKHAPHDRRLAVRPARRPAGPALRVVLAHASPYVPVVAASAVSSGRSRGAADQRTVGPAVRLRPGPRLRPPVPHAAGEPPSGRGRPAPGLPRLADRAGEPRPVPRPAGGGGAARRPRPVRAPRRRLPRPRRLQGGERRPRPRRRRRPARAGRRRLRSPPSVPATSSRGWAATSSPSCSRTTPRARTPVWTAGEDPALVAQRLVATVRAPFDLDGHRISVTTSVGLAVVERRHGRVGDAPPAQRGPQPTPPCTSCATPTSRCTRPSSPARDASSTSTRT